MKIGKIKFSICTFQFAISNIITRHGGTGASRQWTPRINGRLASMDASHQWTPRINGRLALMGASRQWAPRVNGRLASMGASPVLAIFVNKFYSI